MGSILSPTQAMITSTENQATQKEDEEPYPPQVGPTGVRPSLESAATLQEIVVESPPAAEKMAGLEPNKIKTLKRSLASRHISSPNNRNIKTLHACSLNFMVTSKQRVRIRRAITKPKSARESDTPDDTSGTLRLLSSMTKMLIAAAFAVIVALGSHQISPDPPYNWIRTVEIPVQNTALFLMVLGFYQQDKRPRLAKWLQSIGHLLCIEGLALVQAPYLGLPPHIIPLLLVLIAIILLAVFNFS